MKLLKLLFVTGTLLVFFSCQNTDETTGDFKLLPQPQSFVLNGDSSIQPKEVKSCYGISGVELPVCGNLLSKLVPVDDASDAQVIFRVDNSLDVGAEGYTLEIAGKIISIAGKDRAGLLYGFMTLEQLMEDALEQNVSLPECSIRDYPMLAYRAIHLDVKHHLEKTEYYYQLMDKLAAYKINGIIAEVEDKLAYRRQPLVGSEDALSMEEWKKLSDYAMERNIEISPLVQGLGHASFILKHEQYNC